MDDVFALFAFLKSFNPTIIIFVVYEERGLLTSIPMMCEKWKFELQNIDETKEFEKILEKEIDFMTEFYIFQLK